MALTPEEMQEIIKDTFQELGSRTYVGMRYVPVFANPLGWSSTTSYEPLTYVTYSDRLYISKFYVPAGVAPTDNDYWALASIGSGGSSVLESNFIEYENVAEMVADSSSDVGFMLHTDGFYFENDGGAAWYYVSDFGTADGMTVLALENGLFANIIFEPVMNPVQLGAVDVTNLSDYSGCSASNHFSELLSRGISINGNGLAFSLEVKSFSSSKPTTVTIENTRIVLYDGSVSFAGNFLFIGCAFSDYIGALIVENCSFYNCSFTGDSTGSTGQLISTTNTCSFVKCDFSYGNYCIRKGNGTVYVTDSTFSGYSTYGIYINTSVQNELIVDNCTFISGYGSAIRTASASNGSTSIHTVKISRVSIPNLSVSASAAIYLYRTTTDSYIVDTYVKVNQINSYCIRGDIQRVNNCKLINEMSSGGGILIESRGAANRSADYSGNDITAEQLGIRVQHTTAPTTTLLFPKKILIHDNVIRMTGTSDSIYSILIEGPTGYQTLFSESVVVMRNNVSDHPFYVSNYPVDVDMSLAPATAIMTPYLKVAGLGRISLSDILPSIDNYDSQPHVDSGGSVYVSAADSTSRVEATLANVPDAEYVAFKLDVTYGNDGKIAYFPLQSSGTQLLSLPDPETYGWMPVYVLLPPSAGNVFLYGTTGANVVFYTIAQANGMSLWDGQLPVSSHLTKNYAIQ